MAKQGNQFSNGKMGSAITVRISPRSSHNGIDEILDDGTIKIKLTVPPADSHANAELIKFLAEVLGISETKIDIIAGQTGQDKLITILDMSTAQVQEKIIANLS
ncbi:MAG TPA: DUF167 domain-containing protein [Anaerolineaceae bacterium]